MFSIGVNCLCFNGGFMKKILIGLCLLPIISVAAETGDSCSSIVDNEKRLECYDSVFKSGNNLSESGELKAAQGDTKSDSSSDVDKGKKAWGYSEVKDEMRGKSSYIALRFSSNTINQKPPYDGDTYSFVGLYRFSNNRNVIVFGLNKGLFMCGAAKCKIPVKFNDGKIETYTMNVLAGTDKGTLFIDNPKIVKEFSAKLKKAKKLSVELPIYIVGNKQFTIDVNGLNWNHF